MVGDFVHGVLGGSILPLAAYLTEEKQLSADQVAELRKLVEQLEDDGTKKEKRS
jgi:predicted transcriptional regulator